MGKHKNYLIVVLGLWLALFFAQNVHALTPIEAGQKGIDWMAPDTINWQTRNNCFGCHVQGETIWGLSIGKSRGYTIDTAKLSSLVNTLKSWQCTTDGSWYYWPGCTSQWHNETTVFAASALAFYDRMVSTDAQASLLNAAAYLKTSQHSDGYWIVSSNGGIIMNTPYLWGTAMGIITMKRAADLTGDATYKASYEKAVAWLKTQSSTLVQDNAFLLIGLIEGGVPNTDPSILAAQSRLLSYQNTDGGWGRYVAYSSNAYNTGQAVYSLRLAGMLLQDPQIGAGITWLVANQNTAGYWPTGSSGVSTLFSSTMWPVIALGQFGTLGVEVSADPLKQQILANNPAPQTVDYLITVKNTGSQIQDDTYDITVTGAMEGWSATLNQSAITLVPGASGNIVLTVTAPPNLPMGLPSMLTIAAVSRTSTDVSNSVMVTTYTPPEPPVTGHKTAVTILQGNNSVISVCDTVTLSAEVVDQVTGKKLTGPGAGAVNFLVAGIAVGSATDNDGQGVFTITWTPGSDWSKLQSQGLLAVYSGFDFPDTNADLLSSYGVGSMTINPGVCNQPPTAKPGPDQKIECEGPNGTTVTLDGSGSSDPDGNPLTYAWTWTGGSATGVKPIVTLPYGITMVSLVVNDGTVDSLPAAVAVTVQDTTPPVTSVLSIAGTHAGNGWYRSLVTVNLMATDTCSGVKEVHTSVDGTMSVTAGSAASYAVSADGSHDTAYFARDEAGNSEASHPLTIKIDQTLPVITAAAAPTANANGWNNTEVLVTFACSDAPDGIASGIASCTAPVTVTGEGSGQTVSGAAVDKAGNTAAASISLNIDKTAPVTQAALSGTAGASCYGSDVAVALTAIDGLSGVAATQYSVNNGPWQTYTGAFILSAEGVYTIGYLSTDLAGNRETERTVGFTIDKTAPEAVIRFDAAAKDIKVYSSVTGAEADYVVLPSRHDKEHAEDDDDDDENGEHHEKNREQEGKDKEEQGKDKEQHAELRQYTLQDCGNNTLILTLKHKKEGHEAKVWILSMQYNGGPVVDAPRNKAQAEYVAEKTGTIRQLEQKMQVKKQFELEAKYSAGKNETKIELEVNGQKEKKETRPGVTILELLTVKGGLTYQY